jgi:hypothetical protein
MRTAWAKHFDRALRETNADQAIRFVALAKEQLALVAENRLHWISFR